MTILDKVESIRQQESFVEKSSNQYCDALKKYHELVRKGIIVPRGYRLTSIAENTTVSLYKNVNH